MSSPLRCWERGSTSRRPSVSCSCAPLVGDPLYPAVGPRAAQGGGKESPHSDRPDWPAQEGVSVRGSPSSSRRCPPRSRCGTGRSGVPVPTGRMLDGPDRQSQELILENLREAAARARSAGSRARLLGLEDHVDLVGFIEQTRHNLESLYRGGRSWTQLRRDARRSTETAADAGFEERVLKTLGRLRHLDDPERVEFLLRRSSRRRAPSLEAFDVRNRRLLTMLAWGLGSGSTPSVESIDVFFEALWPERQVRRELAEFLAALDERSRVTAEPSMLDPTFPLVPHARYSRQEVVAALGLATGVSRRSPRAASSGYPRLRATSSSSISRRPNATTTPTTMYRDASRSSRL